MFSIDRSGYYNWLNRKPSEQTLANEALDNKIINIFNHHKRRYGCPRITNELRDQGEQCGKNRAFRRMKYLGLRAKAKKKFKVTTDSNHDLPVAPNLLNRGSQYCSDDYQKLLKKYGLICSMSRKGNCWDNAVAESFFHSLKTELIYNEKYVTRDVAKQSIFEYIEVYYNRVRRHSAIGSIAPAVFESQGEIAV